MQTLEEAFRAAIRSKNPADRAQHADMMRIIGAQMAIRHVTNCEPTIKQANDYLDLRAAGWQPEAAARRVMGVN